MFPALYFENAIISSVFELQQSKTHHFKAQELKFLSEDLSHVTSL